MFIKKEEGEERLAHLNESNYLRRLQIIDLIPSMLSFPNRLDPINKYSSVG